MLDKDLAVLYGVKPIRLREQVKRNLARFPGDFMFQLNEQEIDVMVSQNAIPSRKHLGDYNIGLKPFTIHYSRFTAFKRSIHTLLSCRVKSFSHYTPGESKG